MEYFMFFVQLIHEVAIYPDKKVEAMSRPIQTPDVIELTVKHAKTKGTSVVRVFFRWKQHILRKCNQKILLCTNK